MMVDRTTLEPTGCENRKEGMLALAILAGAAVACLPSPASALPTFARRPPVQEMLTARVMQILDGDTLLVELTPATLEPDSGFTNPIVKVDIAAIDSPELDQVHWSYFTGQYLQDNVRDSYVYLELLPEPTETGVLSAYVWRGDVLINEEILVFGHALLEDVPADRRYLNELTAAMEVAQRQGRGVWNFYSPLPLTPTQFRER